MSVTEPETGNFSMLRESCSKLGSQKVRAMKTIAQKSHTP